MSEEKGKSIDLKVVLDKHGEHIYVTLDEKDTMLDLYRKVEEERETIKKNRFQLWLPHGEIFSGNDDESNVGKKLAFDVLQINDPTEEFEIALVGKTAGFFKTVVEIRSIDEDFDIQQTAVSSKERWIIYKTKEGGHKALKVEGGFKRIECLDRKLPFMDYPVKLRVVTIMERTPTDEPYIEVKKYWIPRKGRITIDKKGDIYISIDEQNGHEKVFREEEGIVESFSSMFSEETQASLHRTIGPAVMGATVTAASKVICSIM